MFCEGNLYRYINIEVKYCIYVNVLFVAVLKKVEYLYLERKCLKFIDSYICHEKNIKKLDTRKKLLYNN